MEGDNILVSFRKLEKGVKRKMNQNIFKSEMALHGVTAAELASKLSMSKAALYRKMSGRSEFSRLEILKVIGLFGLSEAKVMNIFFDNKVS